MDFWKNYKDDKATLRQAKKDWRRNHFWAWGLEGFNKLFFVAILVVIGYFSGHGLINPNESGVRTIGGIYLDDGSWSLIVDPDYVTGNDIFWAKRQYIVCSYDSLEGPIVRRYWIGSELETGREPTRLELLEFDRFMLDYFGEIFLTYDQDVFQRKADQPSWKLDKGCPGSPFDASLIPSRR